MPCESHYSDQDHARDLKRELDKVTRFLCLTLGAAGDDLRDSLFKSEPEMREWYANHLKADAERLREEQKQQERKYLKRHALGKLTPEERFVLGLRD